MDGWMDGLVVGFKQISTCFQDYNNNNKKKNKEKVFL